MLVTSSFGFIFWWLAARDFPADTVGLASAIISAMLLLGAIGILGLGTLLIGELPRQQAKQTSIIMTALMIVGLAGWVLGLLYAVAIPWFLPDFRELNQSIGSVLVFSLGVSLTSIGIVLDQALIGLLRGGVQLLRNTIFSLVKLIALFFTGLVLTRVTGQTIYLTWMVGNIISISYIGWLFLKKGYKFRSYRPEWSILRNLSRSALSHHILNLTIQSPNLLLPVIVTVILSSRMNAYFYAAWMIANFAFSGPVALTTVLYAIGAADPSILASKMRLTLRLSLIVGLLANLILFLGAKFVLGLFPPSYAENASWCLRLLGLGFFPLIIKNHFVANCRIKNKIIRAEYLTAIGALGELIIAAIGAKLGGLTGLSIGWLIGLSLEAILMSPAVYRAATATEVKFDLPHTDNDLLLVNSDHVSIQEKGTNKLKIPPK